MDSGPAHHNVDVPIIKRTEHQLLDIRNDDYLSLFSVDSGETKDDVRIPEEVKEGWRSCT